MKGLLVGSLFVLLTLFSLSASAGFEGKQDGVSLKVFNKIDCTTGMTCTRTGNGDFTITADVPVASSITEAQLAPVIEGLTIGRTAVFDYDFAVDGGSIGEIDSGVELPARWIIEKCWFRVETQLVDAGSGTLGMICDDGDTDHDVLTAADQTGVADDGFVATDVVGTAAAMLTTADTCEFKFVIAGAALTAGKLRAWCRYSVY